MKKTGLLILFVIGALTCSFGQSRVGGGFAYGTEVEEFGLNVNGEFFFKDNLAVSPGFIYFFAEDPFNWWELNANLHIYFAEGSAVSAYGLGGINLATLGFDGNSNTEFGLNLGVGTNFDINSAVTPFTQIRFVIGDADQAVFSFGVRFDLN